MRFATYNQIGLPDLLAMAQGRLHDTLNDVDFLETLARHRCIIVPPWIVQTRATGEVTQVTPLIYDADGNLNKARLLVAVACFLRSQRNGDPLHRRFRI